MKKWVLGMLEKFRPQFEEKGRFSFFKPLFEVVENIFFYPSTCTANAPHVRDPLDIKRYMGTVIVAMAPCLLASLYFFGPRIFLMILVSYAVGGIVEVGFALVRKGEVHEGFFVTGMIFPLILPPSTPLWVVAVGVFFGVFFGKEVFGGTGHNIFNPALVGRIFVTICFPTIMTSGWDAPGAWMTTWVGGWMPDWAHVTQAVTAATPMAAFKTEGLVTSSKALLLGLTRGSVGETFHLGVILGGLYLMFTKVSDWRIPVSYIVSVALFGWIGHLMSPEQCAPVMFQLLGGGMLFGAMFMATDPVTSPFTSAGKWIFGIFCGLLTVLIRSLSSYVEGVMFSIVIMNAFVPLIDHCVVMVKYREAKRA